MAEDTTTSTTLDDLIAALPQELYDKIYEETFTFNAATITIDENYRPPSVLQVSRATRAQIMDTYYDSTTFEGKVRTLARWTSFLPEARRDLVGSFHSWQCGIIRKPGTSEILNKPARKTSRLRSLIPPFERDSDSDSSVDEHHERQRLMSYEWVIDDIATVSYRVPRSIHHKNNEKARVKTVGQRLTLPRTSSDV